MRWGKGQEKAAPDPDLASSAIKRKRRCYGERSKKAIDTGVADHDCRKSAINVQKSCILVAEKRTIGMKHHEKLQ